MDRRLKAIIYDMDGVLINTEPLHFRVWKQVFAKRGLDIDYDIYKGCIGATFEYLMDLVLEHYGRNFHGEMEAVRADFAEIKKELIRREGFPEIAGVKEMIRRMYAAGYRLAVASSSPQAYIDGAMEYLGIRDCFAVLNSGEHVAHSKPAPDIFLNTAKRLGVLPQECLIVEDSTNGCLAAKNAGMRCVGYRNPDSGAQDLSPACCRISSWEQFTAAFVEDLWGGKNR